MKSILITGCNRGLGLGLVRSLVASTNRPENVIATCRNLEKAKELLDIAKQHRNTHVLQLDVRNTDTFKQFAEDVECIVGDEGLNVLFNNAGYSPKSTRIQFVKADQLAETFAVNTIGPIMLTKALIPLLKKASLSNKSKPAGCEKAAIINMTSILGSIALNDNGGVYAYRCSKVATNMATKSLSIDLKNDGIVVTSVHPGWVKTDMGGSNAPMSVESCCSSLVEFIRNISERHNGGFFQWDGQELQW